MTPSPKKAPARTKVQKIELTAENSQLLIDLSRAVGLIEGVHDTTKGQRRATVLQEAIDLIAKYLP